MRFFLATLFSSFIFFSCGKKAKDINGDEPIEVSDFVNSFTERKLPITFNQNDLSKKESDSNFIKSKTVLTFVPDSIFKEYFGKTAGIKFYREGRYKAETEETYLFLTAERKEKKSTYIICYDKNLAFSAGMELVHKSTEEGIMLEGGIDKKLTVIKLKNKQSPEGKLLYNKSAYVYNTEGLFTLILTESNEPVVDNIVYNPIDTLPTKQQFTGNYMLDKKNFVSVRDGGKSGKLQFFLTISKKSGNCEGNIRGDINQVKPHVYQYNQADDHCIIEFNFTKNTLVVKELEACGNHRGVRCSFDGSFRKVNVRKK